MLNKLKAHARSFINRKVEADVPVREHVNNPEVVAAYQDQAVYPVDKEVLDVLKRVGEFGWTRVEPKGGLHVPGLGRNILPLEVPKHHDGIDILAEPETPVQSTLDGIIVKAQVGFGKDAKGNYQLGTEGDDKLGNYLVVQSEVEGTTVLTVYAHLDDLEGTVTDQLRERLGGLASDKVVNVNLAPGIPVQKGQVIGYTGMTGNAANEPRESAHLHHEIQTLDPKRGYVNPQEVYDVLLKD